MKELVYAQLETEKNIKKLSENLRTFQDDTQVFKDEMRNDWKRMNKQWGDLANRLGTVAEGVVAPNISRIIKDDTMEILNPGLRF